MMDNTRDLLDGALASLNERQREIVLLFHQQGWPIAEIAAHMDMPEGTISLPVMYPVLKTLDQVVDVDYYIPGCPPESHQIAAVIDTVLAVLRGEAELPPKGSVIGAGGSTEEPDGLKAGG